MKRLAAMGSSIMSYWQRFAAENKMRVVGVDFGKKRIGLAVGEKAHKIATARSSIAASGTLALDADAIVAFAVQEQAELVVLGLPLGFDGEETKASGIIRRLAEFLEKKGMKIAFVDEAFSTVETHDDLKAMGYSAADRKKIIDGESARLILVRYFGEHA